MTNEECQLASDLDRPILVFRRSGVGYVAVLNHAGSAWYVSYWDANVGLSVRVRVLSYDAAGALSYYFANVRVRYCYRVSVATVR